MPTIAPISELLSATTPTLHIGWVIAAGVIAFALISTTIGDPVITLFHEAGHATVAVATGGQVDGIHMHTDGTGSTMTAVHTNTANVVSGIFGYPAPAAFGLLVAWAYAAGRPALALAGLAVVSAGVAIASRNLFGFFVSGVLAALTGWVLLDAATFAQSLLVVLLGWLLLIGGTKDAFIALGYGSTDYDLLEDETVIPGFIWGLAAVASSLWCLWVGGRLLLDL